MSDETAYPLAVMRGDIVWEPFGGLCTAVLAATILGRRAFAAEINPSFFEKACERLARHEDSESLFHCGKLHTARTDTTRPVAELALV